MNPTKSMSAALICAGFVAIPAVVSAAGFQLNGQSATATGMGDTGIANPNEPNASFYNPASMSLNDGLKLYVGDTLIQPSTTYQPAGGGTSVETKSQTFPPPNAHISYDNIAKSGLSVGVGLAFDYGLGITWPAQWTGRTNIKSQELQTGTINPNVAYKLPGVDLSVAAGPRFVLGSVELERSVALGNNNYVEAHLGGQGSGIGAVAAVMYQPLEALTVGLEYRSRVKMGFDDGSVHFGDDQDTSFNSTFRDNPASTEITLPDKVSAGISYQFSKLFVAFDVNYTVWQTYDKLHVDIDTGEDPDAIAALDIDNHWQNAFAFRLGGQYDVTDNFPVRLGLAYDMSPIPDDTVNASLPGNDRLIGSLGVGYSIAGFRADVAYSLVQALERNIDNGEAPAGDYQTTANVVSVSAGYGF